MPTIRMCNKLNQTVVGKDYQNPLDCTVRYVSHYKGITKGKVVINGKKRVVKLIGVSVWMLDKGTMKEASHAI